MGMPTHENRLHECISPYLLEHAGNPVAWQPWDAQALAEARERHCPILLSIGYSACHWCHVMARESFADPQTAAVMNREFVNIKVDREERPDLDRVYQLAFQALNGHSGGWPLTVFLTPDDHLAFFAGTYFPPRRAHGMPAFSDVLERLAAVWREQQDAIRQQNAQLQQLYDRLNTTKPAPLSREPISGAIDAFEQAFDPQHGGLGSAPKFPHPGQLRLALQRSAGASRDAERARPIAEQSLAAMAAGGILDQLGGGFARYSVDDRWEIPHFEKMLSDNGLLLGLYADAAVAYDRDDFATTARATADWMLREMQLADGGLCASLDADSEGEEGRFYVWDAGQICAALCDLTERDAQLVRRRFGFDREPNFGDRWHPVAAVEYDALAREFALGETDVRERAVRGQQLLFAAREQRQRPHRDDKVLTAWNALAIEGLALAGHRLGESTCVEAAHAAIDFLRERLVVGGRLHAVWREGRCQQPAFLDDHAALLSALVTTLQVRWRDRDLAFARELADALLQRFADPGAGGFFQTADDHEALPYRPKPLVDEAIPSANAQAAEALGKLGHLLGETRFLKAASATVTAAMSACAKDPLGHASLVRVLANEFDPPATVLLHGDAERLQGVMARAATSYRPDRIVFAVPARSGTALEALPSAPNDRIVARRCRGTVCDAPVTEPDAIERLLQT